MAFTRKMLAAMGIEPEKIDEIMAAHVEVVNALKDERDTLKADADRLTVVQTELDALKTSGGDWQTKYEAEHTAFEEYKADIQAAETRRTKENAYRDVMKKAGIPDKVIEPLLKIADVDNVKIDKDGTVINTSDIETSIKNNFSDYIRVEDTVLDNPETPPNSQTGKDAFNAMTLTEQMRYANEHPAEVAEYLKGV